MILLTLSVLCEATSLQFVVNNSDSEGLYLLRELIGTQYYTIDSAIVKDQKVVFKDRFYPAGFYELYQDSVSRLEFIINDQEEVQAEIKDRVLQRNVVFSDKENQLLWNYKYFSKTLREEKQVFQRAYKITGKQGFKQKLDSLHEIEQNYNSEFLAASEGTLVWDLVTSSDQSFLGSKDESYTREHFFDKVNFSNPALVRSGLFPRMILEYLKNHTDHTEEGFKITVDKVMTLASANAEVRQFCLMNLLEVFDKVGPAVMFQYTTEVYLLENSCSEEYGSLSGKINGYAEVMPGHLVPNVSLSNSAGEQSYLLDNLGNKKKTIVFFWSSHCSFCEETFPQLHTLLKKNKKKYQLITHSLDKNLEEWQKALDDKNLKGKHYSDLQSWKSPVVQKLKVHKTPSFYVLDAEGFILSRPKDVDELELFVEQN